MEKRVVKLEFNKDDPNSVSKTQKHFAKAMNINVIMAKYDKTGTIDPTLIRNGVPCYGDFTKLKDLQTALEVVNTASEAWERLPGETKIKFKQDPLELISFVDDPKNKDEAIKLGLIPKPDEVVATQPVATKPSAV